MKSETILKKAIEKSVKNGYKSPLDESDWNDIDWKAMLDGDDTFKIKPYFIVIFDPDFARHFWPGEQVALKDHWTRHQRNMLKEPPIILNNQSPSHVLFKGVAPSPPPSPTEKKTNPTPVKRVTHGEVGD